jgi:hypothetical protein
MKKKENKHEEKKNRGSTHEAPPRMVMRERRIVISECEAFVIPELRERKKARKNLGRVVHGR